MADINYYIIVSQQLCLEVISIEKKVGRPFSDNPKDSRLTIRLDQKHREILERYSQKNNVTKNEAVRQGIEKLEEKA